MNVSNEITVELNDWQKKLKFQLSLPLPGEEAQLRMAPSIRRMVGPPNGAKLSSVLILLFLKNSKIYSVLTLRNEYGGLHSGQVSLPGGKPEAGDTNLFQTALRETQEETGLDTKPVELLGELSHIYIPVSNFLVHPYIAYHPENPVFSPDLREVRELIQWELFDLLEDSLVASKEITYGNGSKLLSPYYAIRGHTVWGATAMILSELKEVLRLAFGR